jgi:RimJ/RimL family protein N-acetyltransferase
MPSQVLIRPIVFSDLERIYRWLLQSEIIEHVLLGKGIVSFEHHLTWFDNYSKDATKKVYAIESDKRHVGNISLFKIDLSNRRANLSIFIGDREYRDKGIASRAISGLLRAAFFESSINKINLEVFEDNYPAISCYKKIGFREKGTLSLSILFHNKKQNMIEFTICREEFENGKYAWELQ